MQSKQERSEKEGRKKDRKERKTKKGSTEEIRKEGRNKEEKKQEEERKEGREGSKEEKKEMYSYCVRAIAIRTEIDSRSLSHGHELINRRFYSLLVFYNDVRVSTVLDIIISNQISSGNISTS